MSPPLLMTTLQTLIEEEHKRTLNAPERLGPITDIAQQALVILSTSIVSANHNNDLITAFMLALQKSLTLAFLSHVRGHTAQADFNCRQAIEFTVLGAYLIANQNVDILDISDFKNPKFKPTKKINKDAREWIEQNDPMSSNLLHLLKQKINESTAHAGIASSIFAHHTERHPPHKKLIPHYFFDDLDVNSTRVFLVQLSRLVILILNTLCRANQKSEFLLFKAGLKQEIEIYTRILDDYHARLFENIHQEMRRKTTKSA